MKRFGTGVAVNFLPPLKISCELHLLIVNDQPHSPISRCDCASIPSIRLLNATMLGKWSYRPSLDAGMEADSVGVTVITGEDGK